MFLLLAALAFAAPVPNGAHVIVAPGATVRRADLGWEGTTGADGLGWSAVVVGDAGEGQLVVQEERGCASASSSVVHIPVVVRQADLLPVLAAYVGGTDGPWAWDLRPGTPVLPSGEVGLATLGGVVRVPIQGAQTALYVLDPPRASDAGSGATIRHAVGTFRGGPVSIEQAPVQALDGARTVVFGRCGNVTVTGAPPDPPAAASAAPHEAQVEFVLQRGARLLAPGGAFVGLVDGPTVFASAHEGADGHRCGTIQLIQGAFGPMPVCVTMEDWRATDWVLAAPEAKAVVPGAARVQVRGVLKEVSHAGVAIPGLGAASLDPDSAEYKGLVEAAERVSATFAEGFGAVAACYDHPDVPQKNLEGIVMVSLHVGQDGAWIESPGVGTTMPSGPLACVVDRLSAMHLPTLPFDDMRIIYDVESEMLPASAR